MSDTLESLARAWDEDVEERRTLADLNQPFGHHRDLWEGKKGGESESEEEGRATAEPGSLPRRRVSSEARPPRRQV